MNLDKSAAVGPAGSDRILGFIKRRGPQRIADVATALGITSEAARQQLTRLSLLGLVASAPAPGGVGRPARMWALTEDGHARFPDRHAELTLQLIDAVRAEFGAGALDRMIAQREAAMRAQYAAALAPARDLGERLDRLAAIRTREGYMAEATPTVDGWLLIEHHCPICAAATACQGFCRSELDVFGAVLGDDVTVERTDHQLAGARRCAYRITHKETENPDGLDRRPAGRPTRRAATLRRSR
jgi:predicted ArsR family transcriptional regulator